MSNLNPQQFGIHVDEDAPSYYPENMERASMVLHPDHPLVATQAYLDPNHPALRDYDETKSGVERPHLIQMDNDTFINDGHHRILGARKKAQPIRVNVWRSIEDE